MKNKALIILSALIFLNHNTFGQKIKLSVRYLPNKIYHITNKTASKSELRVKASEEIIKKLNDKGLIYPIITEGESIFPSTVTTGKADADKNIPVKIKYGNIKGYTLVNGEKIPQSNPVSGTILIGKYSKDNVLKVDTIVSDKLDEYLKKAIIQNLENINSQVKFPKNALKQGDEFQLTVPVTVPVQGFQPINATIITNYQLKKIEKKKAYFDLIQSIELSMLDEKTEIKLTGNGNGTAVYDKQKHQIIKTETSLDMLMTIKINEVVFTNKSSSEQSMTIKIEKRKK